MKKGKGGRPESVTGSRQVPPPPARPLTRPGLPRASAEDTGGRGGAGDVAVPKNCASCAKDAVKVLGWLVMCPARQTSREGRGGEAGVAAAAPTGVRKVPSLSSEGAQGVVLVNRGFSSGEKQVPELSRGK